MNDVIYIKPNTRSVSNSKWDYQRKTQVSPMHLIRNHHKAILKPMPAPKNSVPAAENQILTGSKISILRKKKSISPSEIRKFDHHHLPSLPDKSHEKADFFNERSESCAPEKKVRFNITQFFDPIFEKNKSPSPLAFYCEKSIEWSKLAQTIKSKDIFQYPGVRKVQEKRRKLSICDIIV